MTGRRASLPSQTRPQPNGRASAKRASVDFPVVALGASAGGLDAFKKIFDALPANSGMAFVLIQHLDPTHESLMVDLLTGHTPMKVLQATDRMQLARDRVYLIPPGAYLTIEDGTLRLSKPRERHGARMPFDFFLRSLAEECGERAICAILSGTGTDGSLGLKAVKEKGGLVIVQDPEEAAFDGMPRSAIMSGDADLVLTLAKIPQALLRYGRQAYVKPGRTDVRSPDNVQEAFAGIIDLLAAKTPHDLSLYKQGTLQRRIERRMAMAGIDNGAGYLQVLREDSGERELLAKDLLINVTHFFRDPAAFELLGEQIIPELVQRQTLDRPLRIWVPGCSTGEEAYSIAMLFLEHIAAAKRNIKLQVFASDIDADCVAFARNGIYPESIEADVTPMRLARFFTKEDHSYRVVRELREAVVFTSQSLLADAPFSRLDLISCRNLLIYLGAEAQRKALSLFHFALQEGGVLFLGSSETVGNVTDRFEPISKKHRIYRHIGRSRPSEVEFPGRTNNAGRLLANSLTQQTIPRRRLGFGELSQRALFEAYAPASVLINAKHECLYYSGSADGYLKVVSGEGTRDLLAMAREGLRDKLRSAIQRAKQDHTRVTVTGARIKRSGCPIGVTITVLPVEDDDEDLFLVSFVDDPAPKLGPVKAPESAADASRVTQLEQELAATREDLQSAIRDLEMANEEQKAINEEAMSVTEEYQSTNEELETSKEELQSLNEELTALNSQLHDTVEQQRASYNDLQNILNSTDVATLFLDVDYNIRFFTPAAKSLFNIIASDVGRPLGDLTRRFKDDDLLPDARVVLGSHAPIRREVRADDGSWFMRGALPYRSGDGRVDGLVITFAGISEIKAAERQIEAARAYLDSIIATIRQPLVVLDDDLRVVSASSSFHRIFSVKPEDLIGRHLRAAGDHLDVPALREFLASIQARGTTISDQEIEIELPGLGRRSFSMSARVLREEPSARRKVLVAIVDVTDLKREGKALEAAKSEAERANVGKSRFLAAASHDLRQPLQTISLLQGMLEKRVRDETTLKLVRRLDETVNSMSSMLDKLLDINQLEAGIVRPTIIDFPIKRLLDELRTEFKYYTETNGLDWRVVSSSLTVRSDPRLLEQIMRNLLSNAVKYTTKGKLLLGCLRRDDKLRIEVWDTGPGIPELELPAIFEEFHQLDNPARERSKGLGLGLAIVQRLADLLGHKIDVRSRLGAGSVFTIEVPLGRPELAKLPAPSQKEAQESTPSRGTVLIVEDDPAVLEMLQLLFDAEGHRTLVAADGHKAQELVAQHLTVPDLIIADYNLPKGLNGLETIARVQKQAQHAVPAIILTGDISTDSLREIAGQGCVHLNKPVRATELTRLAQRLIAKPRPAASDSVQQLPLSLDGGGSSTIFVVDDDRAIREAMRDLLSENGYAVELFADGEAFLAGYRPGREGCLLVDVLMPGMSGVELIERLKTEGHQLPAIMITGSGAVPMAVQAMKAGAVDFIEKPVGHGELLASVKRALDQTRDTATQSARRETAALSVASLTTRQRQILDLVLAGHPSKNIAADLGISQRTVDNHRAAIMKKTGSKSLPALIRTALAAA
jgi:two-component system, chemotaxis family, CheB/CheR fusion protein